MYVILWSFCHSNNICDSDLWKGTSKAAEGHLAEVCFTKAKEEGMVVACGCMSDEFLARAKSNHFSELRQAGNDPEEYANRMCILGKYHSCDIHEWIGDDGKTHRCPWHPRHVCSCGK